ncbi:hypothetical protein SD28_04145 [Allofrancisella guangzhouensis]|uniref:Uncharacterized protein n=1 Tax=Allofrancisella guangzhouensis TaxID=594679 RepID=A0A0A8E9M8_9GAMM|nr:hypothetical protein [Allofrancisella guangzhouensis]AJC48876.1 hypothetical protein SD28_04145 [Allofrancisella guangzhouensis]
MEGIHNDIGKIYPCNILIYIAVLYIYDFRTLKFDPIVIKDAKIDPNLISYKYAHTELTRNSNKDDINDSAALFVFYKLFE